MYSSNKVKWINNDVAKIMVCSINYFPIWFLEVKLTILEEFELSPWPRHYFQIRFRVAASRENSKLLIKLIINNVYIWKNRNRYKPYLLTIRCLCRHRAHAIQIHRRIRLTGRIDERTLVISFKLCKSK